MVDFSLAGLTIEEVKAIRKNSKYRQFNSPPNASVKRFLQTRNSTNEILMEIVTKYMQMIVKEIRFTQDMVTVLQTHGEQAQCTRAYWLEFTKVVTQGRELKPDVIELIDELSPRFRGIPFRFTTLEGDAKIEIELKQGNVIHPAWDEFEDAWSLIRFSGDTIEIAIFTFLYLLDQHELLFGERTNGVKMQRFQSIFASRRITEALWAEYGPWIRALRELKHSDPLKDHSYIDIVNESKRFQAKVDEDMGQTLEEEEDSE